MLSACRQSDARTKTHACSPKASTSSIFAIVVIGSHTPMTGSWNHDARTMVLSFGTMFWRARSSGWLA